MSSFPDHAQSFSLAIGMLCTRGRVGSRVASTRMCSMHVCLAITLPEQVCSVWVGHRAQGRTAGEAEPDSAVHRLGPVPPCWRRRRPPPYSHTDARTEKNAQAGWRGSERFETEACEARRGEAGRERARSRLSMTRSTTTSSHLIVVLGAPRRHVFPSQADLNIVVCNLCSSIHLFRFTNLRLAPVAPMALRRLV